MNALKRLTFACLILFCFPAIWRLAGQARAASPAQADAGDATLAGLEKRMQPVASARSVFRQERHLSLFDQPLVAEGVMFFQAPGFIRWETTKPYRSAFLSDGANAAQFEWIDGRRRKLKIDFPRSLSKVIEHMSLMNQGRLGPAKENFNITASTGETAVINMTPRDDRAKAFRSSREIRMAPDLSATREILMNEPGGDFTRITIVKEDRNIALPASAFDMNDPADIEVLINAPSNTSLP